MSDFGSLLRRLRKEKRITQRRMAELVGIDFTYISKIENGTMDPPAEDKIIRMAEVLEVDPEDLIIAANKIPTRFRDLITSNEQVPVFLRKASRLTPEHWEKIREVLDEVPEEDGKP